MPATLNRARPPRSRTTLVRAIRRTTTTGRIAQEDHPNRPGAEVEDRVTRTVPAMHGAPVTDPRPGSGQQQQCPDATDARIKLWLPGTGRLGSGRRLHVLGDFARAWADGAT